MSHGRRPSRLRRAAAVLAASATLALAGCQTAANARLLLPAGWTGLVEVSREVRVERSANAEQREAALRMHRDARARLAAVLGEVQSQPVHVFCFTADCYQHFGGGSPRAKSFGSLRALYGPDGLTTAYVAHEWWHAELHLRLGYWQTRRVPRWFDEGVAVWVSDDPRYGEAMYQRVLAQGIVPPTLAELRSMDGFIAAIGRHGDHLWASKPADAVTVVYPTAAHEVRRWLAIVGPDGLRRLVAALADGADFDTLYPALEHQALKAPRSSADLRP